MSEEFFNWFESIPGYNQVKNHIYPSLKEEKCVKVFFEKHIKKDKKTGEGGSYHDSWIISLLNK